MADHSAIQWTEATWNPTTGCDRVSAGCDNCLAPETRVLRADMTWIPIGLVKVGDRLVSFTDEPGIGQNRVWEEAMVQATWETEKPTVSIEMANGVRFTASEDHRWLIAKRGADNWWRTTLSLNFKTELRTIRCEPVGTFSEDYQAGYIAGATAGDGTFRWDPEWRSSSLGYPQSYWRVAKLASDAAVLDRLVTYLARFGVEAAIRPFEQGPSIHTDMPREMAKVETRRLANMPIIAGLCGERDSREWMAGWLAGMFDTDASYSGGNLRYCQAKPNDVLDRVVRYGKELGFELQREDYKGNTGGQSARLTAGIAENIAFLGAISPALERRCRDFYGRRVDTVDMQVVGIRRGPAQRLIDITTSTGTFIAEGVLTHNCYALTMAKRLKAMGSAKYQTDGDPRTSGPGFGLAVHPDTLDEPLRWRKPRTVFVNSMPDLFHARVPREFLVQVFAVMAATPQHTYQILSKRPERMARILDDQAFWHAVAQAYDGLQVDEAHSPEERWKPIPGLDGYEASTHGRIRGAGGILATGLNPRTGRESLTLWNRGEQKTMNVHRLVLLAHVPQPDPAAEACHRNGNKLDNRLANLRWGTRSENQAEKTRHGSRGGPKKLTLEQVDQIRRVRRAGATQQQVADRFGVSRSLISMIESGRVWSGPDMSWPLPGVWLGTSIESDEHVRRADRLRETAAAVRFISAEPLLGPLHSLDLTGIDWLIIGGESGPNARPMALGWVYDLIAKAREANTAVFVKQLGSRWSQHNASLLPAGERVSGKGGNWDHWPGDVRIREYPRAAEAVPNA